MQQTKTNEAAKRRRWRFSLRTFFLLFLVAAICVAPVAYEVHFYRKSVALSAKARRHFNGLPGSGYYLSGNTVEAPFYRRWLNYPPRCDSYQIYAEDSAFGDEDFQLFVQYHRKSNGQEIRGADFRNSRVTDTGLRSLKRLDQIRRVKAGYDPYMYGYWSYQFEGPPVLPRDPWPGSKITDRGLMYLCNISSLEEIRLHNTEISDEGLAHLSKLKRLETLYLVYDEDPLGDPPAGSKITDAGIKHLAKLSQLKELVVEGTGISGEGIQKLSEALPDCSVFDYEPACGCCIY